MSIRPSKEREGKNDCDNRGAQRKRIPDDWHTLLQPRQQLRERNNGHENVKKKCVDMLDKTLDIATPCRRVAFHLSPFRPQPGISSQSPPLMNMMMQNPSWDEFLDHGTGSPR